MATFTLITLIPAAAQQVLYDHGDPTDYEQLALEIVNRTRMEPAAVAAEVGIRGLTLKPVEPLAFHRKLIDSARGHAQWLEKTDLLSHLGESGSTSTARMTNAGFPFAGRYGTGENVGRQGNTNVSDSAINLIDRNRSWLFASTGHRDNTLDSSFKHIGIGFVLGNYVKSGRNWLGGYIVENYAYTSAALESGPFALGVCFEDKNQNDRYDPGEGIAGIDIRPERGGYYTVTSSSGGYALPINAGMNVVDFRASEIGHVRKYIENAGGNMKIDLQSQQLPRLLGNVDYGDVSLYEGEELAFEARVEGADATDFRWLKNGTVVAEGSRSLILPAVIVQDAGHYELEVKVPGSEFYVVVQVAQVAIAEALEPPQITAQPQAIQVELGAPAMLEMEAAGDELTFQWEKDGTALPGQNEKRLSLSSARLEDAGQYRVSVSNRSASVFSHPAKIDVLLPLPTVTTHPADQEVTEGDSVYFSAAASGEEISYQWEKDGKPLEGQTALTLMLKNVQLVDAGVYRLIASNSRGSVESDAASLMVNEGNTAHVFIEQFEAWAATAGILTGQRGDDDGDGIANVFEFVLAQNPRSPDKLPLPRVNSLAGQFEWSVPLNLSIDTAIVTIEVSSGDGGEWVSPEVLGFQLVRNPGRITVIGSTGDLRDLYLRLGIAETQD